jgi:photosystem II stability/assembly factor-like uncharacterized protein
MRFAPAFAALALGLAIQHPTDALAQRATSATRTASAPAYDGQLYSSPTATSNAFKSLRWRNIGPTRGGRANAVIGDLVKPFTFYTGGVNGGVWRTSNGGQSWSNITDGKTDISSVGAIAIAPSDPNVMYVGTGESQLREDLTFGTGVYRSTDAGSTWQKLGLTDSHQIADIIVDPRDADRAYVAAMGHAFGPNSDRGVFRTVDGGKTWKKVLFINDSTGANDLSIDPSNPRILYASFYKFQRTPWSMNAGGGRSGIWKSLDGGDTWTELTFRPGIPAKPLGKIGIDVSPANPRRVYASIEAPDSSGGIFRSDDAGESWERMNTDPRFWVRSWYYSLVTADPQNENTVYVMNLTVYKSIDGGKTFKPVRVPHGDTHALWIDPKNSQRMINSNDGGGTISFDGGDTWSSIYNQPTAQFYHVTTDNQFPYRIYGGQQDNSAISIASRSDDGEIGERDYYDVAGCENATVAVDPRNPLITYGGCYMGHFSRSDHGRRQSRDISVTMPNYDGWGAADVPERFQWTFPVLLSPHDPKTLYVTSQHVWRSRTEGASWEKISPDLTVHDASTLKATGGPIHGEMTGAEWYATIYAFAESPKQAGVLWAGSDDGMVHVSKNGGTTWENVTPPGYGRFTRTAHIDASPHDAGTVYVAANRYQQDDFAPYLYKSADYGKSWTRIVNGIPGTAFARVVREDVVRKGLLYAGTEYGVWVSMNDGAAWEPMQLNLPRVSVRDLKVHGNDLIAATHGRAFWVIDDLSPLREMSDAIKAKPVHLFQPAAAVLWDGYGWNNGGNAGENPPPGALVDYWLREKPVAGTSVSVQFLDAKGTLIRNFVASNAIDTAVVRNDSLAAKKPALDSISYYASDSIPRLRPGSNRFHWDLRYPEIRGLKNTVIDEGHLRGAMVPPGNYTVRLIVGKDTSSRQFAVSADPRATSTTAELTAQFDAAQKVRARLEEIVERVERLEDLQSQLDARVSQTKDQTYGKQVADSAKVARERLEQIRTKLYETACHVNQCTLDQPVQLYNWYISLNAQLQTGAYAPTQQNGEVYSDLTGKLTAQLKLLDSVEQTEIRNFNTMLQGLGIPSVFVKPKPPIS